MPRGKKTRAGRNRRRDTEEEIRLHDIHSRIKGLPAATHQGHAHNLNGSSTSAQVIAAAKYYDCTHIDERAETHVVPRQSITRKQFLGVFSPKIETETMQAHQLDHKTGEMVPTTDERLTWKSDRTLLKRGKPFEEIGTFKREGSVSIGLNKRRNFTNEKEIQPTDTVLGPAIDDDVFGK